MTAASEDQFRKLLVMRSQISLKLANRFLSLASPSGGSGESLDLFPGIMRDLRALEAVHIALLVHSGVSWDALASHYGVTRQALHKRLRTACDSAMNAANEDEELRERMLWREVVNIEETYYGLLDYIDSDLERGGAIWAERRKIKGWWWEDDDAEKWLD